MTKFFLFGLGNPGEKYINTRHNAGYRFISYFFKDTKFKSGKGNFFYAEIPPFIGILPSLYMNENGKIILELKEIFSINLFNLILFLDDLNLSFGAIRFRMKGSDGGHKGLKSCIYYIETEELKRLRIGIGFNYNVEAEKYVLEDFKKEELDILNNRVFPYIKEGIYKFLKEGDFNNFENYINNYPWKERVQIPYREEEV